MSCTDIAEIWHYSEFHTFVVMFFLYCCPSMFRFAVYYICVIGTFKS